MHYCYAGAGNVHMSKMHSGPSAFFNGEGRLRLFSREEKTTPKVKGDPRDQQGYKNRGILALHSGLVVKN